MNLYCIWHLRSHYKNSENYMAEEDQSSNLFQAREGEDRDAFIARLIEEFLPAHRMLPDCCNSYETLHIDYLFYSEDVETNLNITTHPVYLKKKKEAEIVISQREALRIAEQKEIKRREYERLKKEFENKP